MTSTRNQKKASQPTLNSLSSPETSRDGRRSGRSSDRSSDSSVSSRVHANLQRNYANLEKDNAELETTLNRKDAVIAELQKKIDTINQRQESGRKVILNKELVKATKEASKHHVSQTVKFVVDDGKHEKKVAEKCLQHINLPEGMSKEEYIRDYAATAKNGVADGRQYVQSRCKDACKGKNFGRPNPSLYQCLPKFC